MWDSAKKPMKIRSVLRMDGSRHYLLGYNDKEELKRFSAKSKKILVINIEKDAFSNGNCGTDQEPQSKERRPSASSQFDASTELEKIKEESILPDLKTDLIPIQKDEVEENFLQMGISGSKLYNAKRRRKKKVIMSYYGGNYRPDSGFLSLKCDDNMKFGQPDYFDLVPVKSPLIKRLINSGRNSGHGDAGSSLSPDMEEKSDASPENTLCSRIMTWIDLEVRKNGTKNNRILPSSISPTDLRIMNGLMTNESESSSSLANSVYNSTNTSSKWNPKMTNAQLKSKSRKKDGESNSSSSNASSASDSSISSRNTVDTKVKSNSNSSSSSCSSTGPTTLPKLISNLKKPSSQNNGVKVKKTVTIAEDLPKNDYNGKSTRRRNKNNGDKMSKGGGSLGVFSEKNDVESDDETGTASRNNKTNGSCWGEVKIDDCTVYLMGETKSRNVCKIEVPERNLATNYSSDTHFGKGKGDPGPGKVQLHIFLPLTDRDPSENCHKSSASKFYGHCNSYEECPD